MKKQRIPRKLKKKFDKFFQKLDAQPRDNAYGLEYAKMIWREHNNLNEPTNTPEPPADH